MTGIFLRVRRDGAMGNVEIDRMTDVELDELAAARAAGGDDGWRFAIALARWIRDNVSEAEPSPAPKGD